MNYKITTLGELRKYPLWIVPGFEDGDLEYHNETGVVVFEDGSVNILADTEQLGGCILEAEDCDDDWFDFLRANNLIQ